MNIKGRLIIAFNLSTSGTKADAMANINPIAIPNIQRQKNKKIRSNGLLIWNESLSK
ncbi:hypothetical protein KUC3_09130 [Alteromonas sp. KC3]|nr:hypothetical protein KUC3_09130 [Alteromonas sp. KC3]BCO22017.1 hypothetical protein KUC14_08860 [Alteromonas sp. KC14]